MANMMKLMRISWRIEKLISIAWQKRAITTQRTLSSLSLVDLSMAQYTGARTQKELTAQLVQLQVLKTKEIIQAFESIDRSLFIDDTHDLGQQDSKGFQYKYAEPYENVPQKLRGVAGSTMSTPHHHAVIAELFRDQLLRGKHSLVNALDMGCGSGYLTALFAKLIEPGGGSAVGTECVPELLELAGRKCANYKNVKIQPSFTSKNEWNLHGNFDIIHVGFAVSEETVQQFLPFLSMGGCLVAPMMLENTSAEHQLVRLEKTGSSEIGKFSVMTVLCQEMQPVMCPSMSEVETPEQRLSKVKAKLESWTKEFQRSHGRMPSRDDMFASPEASELFKEFSNLRKKSW